MSYPLNDSTLLKQAAYINGQWETASTHGHYTVFNPANNEPLAHLPRLQTAATCTAIEAAQQAWLDWKTTTAQHRATLLRSWFNLIQTHRDDLATILTLEQGKPLAEAKAEIDYAASFVEWFAEEAKRIYGEIIPPVQRGQKIMVLKEPIGVCAAITPWNFPAAMVTRKVAPALAAGCSIVLKPASQTPLTGLALAELAHRAGFPAGLFNVLTGNDTALIGNELTRHPMVRKLTFTGSTEVGRILLAQAAPTIKKCSMELGGNAPFMVFDDADLDAAVEGVITAKFRNTGQTCISANRILVQDSVYDDFAAKLLPRLSALQVGNGLAPGVEQGPLIDDAALQKVETHLADACAKGARIASGGKRHALGGRFFEPTLLLEVNATMQLAQEETFGPIAPLFRFQTEAEAIALANATDFGLAAYLYSQNAARIWRVASALETGMVGINTAKISTEVAPFGGIKQSGLGREGSHYGIDDFLELKYLNWNGLE